MNRRHPRLTPAESSAANNPGRRSRTAWRAPLVITAIVLLASLGAAAPAAAHGGDESKEGYVLVQQALSHLAHDTGHTGIDLAMEKIDDTLAAKDQEGVAVAQVKAAKAALHKGEVEKTRTLLQGSIKEALAALKPAVGEETGTTLVSHPQDGRTGGVGREWGFLVGSLLLIVVGVGLAFRFRPADNVRALRQRLETPAPSFVPLGPSSGESKA